MGRACIYLEEEASFLNFHRGATHRPTVLLFCLLRLTSVPTVPSASMRVKLVIFLRFREVDLAGKAFVSPDHMLVGK